MFSDAGKLFVARTVTVCKFNKHAEPGKEPVAQLDFSEGVACGRRERKHTCHQTGQ